MNELLVEFLQNILERKRSAASLEAEKLGLVSKGFNWWAKEGEKTATHKTVDGKIVAIERPSDKNLPARKQRIGSMGKNDPELDALRVGITPDSLRAAALVALGNRTRMLSRAIRRKENERISNKLKEYKQALDALETTLNNSPVDVKKIKQIMGSLGIKSYKDLLESPVFGRSSPEGVRMRLDIGRKLHAHLPDLFSDTHVLGTLPTSSVGTAVRDKISTRSLFPDSTLVFPITDGNSITIGSQDQRITRVPITDEVRAKIDEYLNSDEFADLTDDERAAKRVEIIVRLDVANRSVDFIEKHSEGGFIEFPRGPEGAQVLQDKLRDTLFASQDDKKEFDTLVSAYRTASAQNFSATWESLHTFLTDKLKDEESGTVPVGLIPAICEHLDAMRLMNTEPDATVYMPVSTDYAVADILVLRKNQLGKTKLALLDTTYIADLNSVKRGETPEKSGRPSTYASQMELTVMSDDPVLGGAGTSRAVLDNLVRGGSPSEEDLIILKISTEQAVAEFLQEDPKRREKRIQHLMERAKKCICPDGDKACSKQRVAEYRKAAEEFFVREALFRAIYNKHLAGQGFSNTTFHKKGINRSDGVKKKAKIKPDFRAKCKPDGSLSHRAENGRAYIVSL
jgi:hypothetical protein